MKNLLLFVIVSVVSLPVVCGQGYDNIWLMGYNYDQSNDSIEGTMLSFTDGILELSAIYLPVEMQSSSISICNSSGDLQFYTNGCNILNWEHGGMDHGEGLNPGETYQDYCINDNAPWRAYYPSGKQSTLTLPQPGQDSVYYLFHKGVEVVDDPIMGLQGYTRPLYFSIIDMRYNSGLGRVVEKNHVLLSEDMFFGQLTAVKHANGIDWWIFTPSQEGTNGYFYFLLTAGGVSEIEYQEAGISGTQEGGWANFSPNGTKYARYNPVLDDLYLFDFDRSTGELSNFQQIVIEEEAEWVGGVAFSPNSRYLYVSSYDYIYQFDTEADDVAASRVVVAQYQYLGQFLEHNFWGMQLGPDCRLYVYCNSCDVIHVIHHPDEPGLACGFEQGAVQLPWPIFRSQPHFPNYRLGPVGDEGLPCTPVVSVEEVPIPSVEVVVYPNPAKGYMTLSPRGISGHWQLFDGLGRSVLSTRLHTAQDVTVDVSHLPTGMYYWKLSGTPLDGKVVVGR